jgi:hypothetical protein
MPGTGNGKKCIWKNKNQNKQQALSKNNQETRRKQQEVRKHQTPNTNKKSICL